MSLWIIVLTSGSLCDYFHYLLIIFVINLLIAYEVKKKKKSEGKGREEERCVRVQVHMDIQKRWRFKKYSKKSVFKLIMREEMLSTHILDLIDSHNAFWCVTLNVNVTFAYKNSAALIIKD